MRALRDPDAFLPTDLGVRHALELLGRDGSPAAAERLSAAWRPYRAYARAAPLGPSGRTGGEARGVSRLVYTRADSPIGELLLTGDGEVLHGLHMLDGRRPIAPEPAWMRDDDAFPSCAPAAGRVLRRRARALRAAAGARGNAVPGRGLASAAGDSLRRDDQLRRAGATHRPAARAFAPSAWRTAATRSP